MAVTINARGTSSPTFTIGKGGPTILQGTGAPTGGNDGDIWIRYGGTDELYQKISGVWTPVGTGGGGSGTVTSIDITAPASGITSSGGPITTSGSITLALANDLAAVEGLSTNGYAVRTATDTWTTRSIVDATNGGITITNGNGVSGNTTVALNVNDLAAAGENAATGDLFAAYNSSATATQYFTLAQLSSGVNTSLNLSGTYQPLDSDLTALSGTSTTGLYAITGTGTSATRTITGTTNQISVSNGDGVSGNPTLAIANNPIIPGNASITIPVGTSAQEPTAANGMLRYDSDTNKLRAVINGTWTDVSTGGSLSFPLLASPIGTNSNPAYSFTGDTSTGAYSPGASQYSITLGGTDSLSLTTSTATFANDVVVTGNLTVNGTTTTIHSTTLQVDDKNIEIGNVASPSNTTANGGGITLKGTTDKTIIWDNTNTNWTSSEHWNLASGKSYKINNITIVSKDSNDYVQFVGGSNSAVIIPGSTTDGTAVAGALRYNNGVLKYSNGSTWTTLSASSGTVTSVDITAPAAGITSSGGPVTTSGAITLALANDLAALEGLSGTGYAVRTGTDAWAQRSIVDATNGGITVTNGTGVSGNTSLALNVNDLAAAGENAATGDLFAAYNVSGTATQSFTLAQLSNGVSTSLNLSGTYQPLDSTLTSLAAYNTNGILTQTAADTFTGRTITGTTNQITMTNGDGVSGNPTIAIANNAVFPGTGAVTIPASTSANQPTAANGMIRYDTDTNKIRAVINGTWTDLSTTVGTVTSVNLTQPSEGITVSGGPITSSGSITLALANDLAGLEGLTTNGIAARTATSTWTTRTISNATNGGLTVTNGDGVSGNPTLALNVNNLAAAGENAATGDLFAAYNLSGTATQSFTLAQLSSGVSTSLNLSGTYQPLDSDLTALANTATTGIYAVTGSGTSSTRTITGTTNQITMTNGDGISGNPTIAIANNAVFPGTGSVTIPASTTANQPSATNGMIRYDTDTNKLRAVINGTWADVQTGTGGLQNQITDGAQASVQTAQVSGQVTINANDAGTTRRVANFYVSATGANAAALDFSSKQNEIDLVASGAGTNIDILFVPKGSGKVIFGTAGTTATLTAANNASGNGENILITAGSSTGGNGNGGIVTFTPGALNGTGTNGYFVMTDASSTEVVRFAGSLTDGKFKVTGNAVGVVSALTDAATISVDFSLANNFSVTLGGNRTLANPTNAVVGQAGTIVITQDGTGSRTLAFGSNWKFASGIAPTLTTTAGAVDVLSYYVDGASRITAKMILDSR